MTHFHCPKHGDIGHEAIDTHKLVQSAAVHAVGPTLSGDLNALSLPQRRYLCARCASELIDGFFAPLREK